MKNDLNRRGFIAGGGTASASLLLPTRAEAFFPLLGPALAGLALQFGVRLGGRALLGTALNLSRTGLSLSAQTALRLGRRRMRRAFPKVQPQVTLTANVPFFAAVSRDDKNACCVFVPLLPNGNTKGDIIMLEGPTLLAMTGSADKIIDKFGQNNARRFLLPQGALKEDISGCGAARPTRRAFKTEHGFCAIAINSTAVPGERNAYRHTYALSVYDKNRDLTFRHRDQNDMYACA